MKNSSSFPKTVIGVIGYGRFGKLLATQFSQHLCPSKFQVVVFSRRPPLKPDQENSNLVFWPLEKISQVDVVIPCVPISEFANTIKNIMPGLKPNSLVMDVCSVKVFPIEVMKKFLPTTVQIIGTHPLFGPDSVLKNKGLNKLPIVLVDVRSQSATFAQIKELFTHLQLQVIELTAEQHDQFAATSQAYAFLIGKISQRMRIQPTPIDTMWYKLLLEEKNAVEHDSDQLFFDLQRKNPFSEQMRNDFLTTTTKLMSEIKGPL